MQITRIETLCLSRLHEPRRQWVTSQYRTIKADCAIVVVHTDADLVGVGEASAYGWPLQIRAAVDWLSPLLLGRDVEDLRIVPHPTGRSRAYDAAVAGIDCALWDLRGKIHGKRVAELLRPDGGLDNVCLYASSGCRYDWRTNPYQLIDEALDYVRQGYTAMKFRIGTEWSWDGVTVGRFLGLVRELAQAVNGRMELMLDGNCRFTEEQALSVARELDRLGFAWFEEPIPQAQIDGYVQLCSAVEMPISGGESFTTLEQFRPYLERRAYDIVQPDVGLCGLTEAMRIAEMAHRYGVGTCPHNWHNGLMTMANGHFVAALPNPHVLELCMIQGPLQWEIFAEPPEIRDGRLILSERPGFGVELAASLEERFPYIEGHYAVQVHR